MNIDTEKNRFNAGNAFGRGMIERSISDLGYGKSIVTDKDGVVLCGHYVAELAKNKNSKIRVVETDGDELVVVVRKDFSYSEKKAKELAIVDNLTSKFNLEWDADTVLQTMNSTYDGFDPRKWNGHECTVKELNVQDLFNDSYTPTSLKQKKDESFVLPQQTSLFD